jgi:hypothetical protein
VITDTEFPAAAAYVAECDEIFRRQVEQSDSLPVHLCLPLPQTPEEWLALKRWLDALTRETGKPIPFEFRPPAKPR